MVKIRLEFGSVKIRERENTRNSIIGEGGCSIFFLN